MKLEIDNDANQKAMFKIMQNNPDSMMTLKGWKHTDVLILRSSYESLIKMTTLR
jgi:hypothetical protein